MGLNEFPISLKFKENPRAHVARCILKRQTPQKPYSPYPKIKKSQNKERVLRTIKESASHHHECSNLEHKAKNRPPTINLSLEAGVNCQPGFRREDS